MYFISISFQSDFLLLHKHNDKVLRLSAGVFTLWLSASEALCASACERNVLQGKQEDLLSKGKH